MLHSQRFDPSFENILLDCIYYWPQNWFSILLRVHLRLSRMNCGFWCMLETRMWVCDFLWKLSFLELTVTVVVHHNKGFSWAETSFTSAKSLSLSLSLFFSLVLSLTLSPSLFQSLRLSLPLGSNFLMNLCRIKLHNIYAISVKSKLNVNRRYELMLKWPMAFVQNFEHSHTQMHIGSAQNWFCMMIMHVIMRVQLEKTSCRMIWTELGRGGVKQCRL